VRGLVERAEEAELAPEWRLGLGWIDWRGGVDSTVRSAGIAVGHRDGTALLLRSLVKLRTQAHAVAIYLRFRSHMFPGKT
jgi:hypothetical protein